MPRRLKVTRESAWACKDGADRGGQARTWKEVAAVLGTSRDYARRVACGTQITKIQVIWLDPRDYVPELAATLSEQAVIQWNADPRCLCECGGQTKQENGSSGKVPYGAPRMFLAGHEQRMPWANNGRRSPETEVLRIKRMLATRAALNMPCGMLTDLLAEYRAIHGTSLALIAERSRLSMSLVNRVANGEKTSVRKLTAARIFYALGEPMRREVYGVYAKWARENKIPVNTSLREGRGGDEEDQM